ncbi:unnamed protein product [Orchesella dallaii]|uniref:Lipase domain-containing protein n=1 Tax=Orchesella dallaii TaxID=48710 RepID=A0ABP1QID6_9HEXA
MNSQSSFVSVIVNLCLMLVFSLGNAQAQISRNADDLRFYYYPTANDGIEIVFNDVASLSASNLKAATATIIVIDGFTSILTSPMAQSVKNAYLENEGDNLNVIVVDWGRLSGSGPEQSLTFPSDITATYRTAIQNVAVVGQRVADFLNFLRANKQIQFSDVIIVGYSLGAHVAGSIGKAVKRRYGGLLARITGLDPAGPLYLVQLNGRLRLDSNDASFVDVYHTNRGVLGVNWDVGQANIYVNGGNSQPGCNIKDILGIIGTKNI